MDGSSNSNYSSNYILTPKCFEMSTVVALFYFPFVSRDCVRRFESQPINVDAFIAVHFCGRYGYFFWPIWSFRVADVVVADMVVADMVCGRCGTDPSISTMAVSLAVSTQYTNVTDRLRTTAWTALMHESRSNEMK